MNGKTAILSVRIIGDAQKAIGSFESTLTASERFANGVKKASAIAVVAIAAIVTAALGLGQVASNLQQAQGAVDAVFGEYSVQVHELARDAAQQTGLAEAEYSSMAAVIGSQLHNMGVAATEQADRTQQLIQIGADLAAQYGGPTSDAVNALSSLLRGERDPIERYGVSIKQADIDARKAALGLSELTGEAEKAADMQATLSLLLEQTASSTGRFTDEAETAAGQQARANAEWLNAQAALGEQLLPYMVEAARIASDLAHWLGENEEMARNVAIAVVILAGVIIALQAAMQVATAAQWAFNAAAAANPVGLVVLLIIAILVLLGTIIYLIITYWEEFEQIGIDAAFAIANAMGVVVQAIENVINAILEAIRWLYQFDLVGNAIRNAQGIDLPGTVRVDLPGAGASIEPGPKVQNIYNITGAIDPQGTAKAIEKVQRTAGRSTGKVGV